MRRQDLRHHERSIHPFLISRATWRMEIQALQIKVFLSLKTKARVRDVYPVVPSDPEIFSAVCLLQQFITPLLFFLVIKLSISAIITLSLSSSKL